MNNLESGRSTTSSGSRLSSFSTRPPSRTASDKYLLKTLVFLLQSSTQCSDFVLQGKEGKEDGVRRRPFTGEEGPGSAPIPRHVLCPRPVPRPTSPGGPGHGPGFGPGRLGPYDRPPCHPSRTGVPPTRSEYQREVRSSPWCSL